MDDLKEFIAKEPLPWAIVAGNHPRNSLSMAQKFGIRAFRSYIVVGKDGRVVDVNCRGRLLGERLEKIFASR